VTAPNGIEVLSDGHQLAEAPRVDDGGGIWFTDVLGGGVHRWVDGSVETVVPKRRGVGGLALHADGGVVMGGRDIVHVLPDGTQRTVFTPPEGVEGFNDLCALPDGSIIVGALRWRPFGAETAPERVPGEFWHVGLDGSAEPFVEGITWSNGCGVDVVRRRTYCCDYAAGRVWMRDGDDPDARVFADVPGGEADGLAVDDDGGVWVATAQGGTVVRLDPGDGSVTDTIEIGGYGLVASVAFDGADSMIVTTMTSVLRLPAPVPGPRHLLARV
jgi:gluconolactonase